MKSKNVTFYLLDNNIQKNSFSTVERMICEITAERWKRGKRILISCENKRQAIHLNEVLWMHPLNNFIPHNLSGEGPKKDGAPVEITWLKKQSNNNNVRDILINLQITFSDFSISFSEVIDFIPYEESLKQFARERYKAYRLAGFNLNMKIWK